MIYTIVDKIARVIVSAIVGAVKAIRAEFVSPQEPQEKPPAGPPTMMAVGDAPPEAEAALKKMLGLDSQQENRKIRSFEYHLSKQILPGQRITRTEVIEAVTGALETIADEIKHEVGESSIDTKVERDGNMLYGHLCWTIDKHSPDVYDIVMELLQDGFTYRTESNSFVITSRLEK